MKVVIASDHAGFPLKKHLIGQLNSLTSFANRVEWIDVGPSDTTSVDYPDFADLAIKKATELNSKFSVQSGVAVVLICGSGQGMSIRANKYSHVRAALCWDTDVAKLSREHNDANVLCLGARLIPYGLAEMMITTFLNTKFLEGRHTQRVNKLSNPC